MPSVFVGESHLPKDFKRYSKQYSFLELDCEPGNIPGRSRLQACAAAAPEGFVFSLIVPSAIASLDAAAWEDRAWKQALAAAETLRSRWWVVRTPTSVRPTRRTREQLAAVFERLKDGGRRVAWEPHGVWDEAGAAETAAQLGVHVVQDIAREEPLARGVLYTRLLALGRGAKVGLSLADRVATRALEYSEAFVVVEGRGALEVQKAVRAMTGGELMAEDVEDDELEGHEAEDAGAEDEDVVDEDDAADSSEAEAS
jgi:uncharacterized protein YecE (DUF72 family)